MELTETRRLYQQLAAELKQRIEAGVYPVGDKLPAERCISEEMNVSRTVVREAIIMLEVEGYVEVRKGSGIHVMSNQQKHLVMPNAVHHLGHLDGDPGSGTVLWRFGAHPVLRARGFADPGLRMERHPGRQARGPLRRIVELARASCGALVLLLRGEAAERERRLLHVARLALAAGRGGLEQLA
ncbi:MAG: GntR family transcriptional regulator, partial [Yersinia sp. (in: enterobacteria)]